MGIARTIKAAHYTLFVLGLRVVSKMCLVQISRPVVSKHIFTPYHLKILEGLSGTLGAFHACCVRAVMLYCQC